ncbi:hypothetical protein BRADI_1g47175v3 [Brachypodium distachyon]|uniref:Uncharacterized protein n=1 Tax=Brachypodium distachyon TaxID=15368 RepID=A0A2K2DPZ4_BRADI|nr:hypothetical protein BRADI_1g47175v3 [Brachypodium distachyon]
MVGKILSKIAHCQNTISVIGFSKNSGQPRTCRNVYFRFNSPCEAATATSTFFSFLEEITSSDGDERRQRQ